MKNHAALVTFHELAKSGRNAGLDINRNTGEIACKYTISNSKSAGKGLGTPPIPMGEAWVRLFVCSDGNIKAV